MNYTEIFRLIDQSNRPLMYKNGKSIKHPTVVEAENKLVELGIYDDEGLLITKDKTVLDYFEYNWS